VVDERGAIYRREVLLRDTVVHQRRRCLELVRVHHELRVLALKKFTRFWESWSCLLRSVVDRRETDQLVMVRATSAIIAHRKSLIDFKTVLG
jgi:hypothetical protein